MHDCCEIKANLVPIIFRYHSDKLEADMYGVSHFVCTECMSNICVDDTFDQIASGFLTVKDYATKVLSIYNIEEYK